MSYMNLQDITKILLNSDEATIKRLVDLFCSLKNDNFFEELMMVRNAISTESAEVLITNMSSFYTTKNKGVQENAFYADLRILISVWDGKEEKKLFFLLNRLNEFDDQKVLHNLLRHLFFVNKGKQVKNIIAQYLLVLDCASVVDFCSVFEKCDANQRNTTITKETFNKLKPYFSRAIAKFISNSDDYTTQEFNRIMELLNKTFAVLQKIDSKYIAEMRMNYNIFPNSVHKKPNLEKTQNDLEGQKIARLLKMITEREEEIASLKRISLERYAKIKSLEETVAKQKQVIQQQALKLKIKSK